MQVAAGLLASLGDAIENIEAHLASMESATLYRMLRVLPAQSHVASAEGLMRTLVTSEIEMRRNDTKASRLGGHHARLH